MLDKRNVTKAAGSLKLSKGQDTGASIHTMIDIFDVFADVDTNAVFLINAENGFIFINRKVMLHKLKVIYPIIATSIISCHGVLLRLFIVGGEEIFSCEGQIKLTQQLRDHVH